MEKERKTVKMPQGKVIAIIVATVVVLAVWLLGDVFHVLPAGATWVARVGVLAVGAYLVYTLSNSKSGGKRARR